MSTLRSVEIILFVSDQVASRHFYQKILGKSPDLDVPGMTEFSLSENCTLGLMPVNGIAKILGNKTRHPAEGDGIPRCEIYLRVERVEAEFDNAVAIGAKLVSPVSARDWGDRVCYFADPDGHIIAFAEKIGVS
ncbi:MAG: VOC family protein [Pyrinomonadaceae bacterium]